MPDEYVDDPLARSRTFYARMGISENAYPFALDGALAHATSGAAAVPPAHHWVPIGPRSIGGRVRTLVQHPTRPLLFYAGSAHGGVWRTLDGGDTWTPMGNPEHALPVGALGVSAQHPDVVYVGTGDPIPFKAGGRGLFRFDFSPGAATPFQLLAGPAATSRHFAGIAVDPDDGNRFWAATTNGLWRCELAPPVGPAAPVPTITREFPTVGPPGPPPAGEPALAAVPPVGGGGYATDVLAVPDTRSAATVVIGGRTVPRYLLVYVAVYGQGLYRGRLDRGSPAPFRMEWRDRLPLPTPGTFTRLLVAACRTQPQHLYAVAAEGGNLGDDATEVYYSSDHGDTWEKRSHLPGGRGQAWYSMVLFVHPENPRVVVHGTVDLFYSSDGADSWSILLDWTDYYRGDRSRHADQHWGFFDRFDRDRLWLVNDGGIAAGDLRRPPAARGFWRKRSHGISAAQFNDITVHPRHGWITAGGLQDNGSYLGYGGDSWFPVGGGDGGSVSFDAGDPRRYFLSTAGSPEGGWMWRANVAEATEKVPDSAYVAYSLPEAPVASGVFKVHTGTLDMPDGFKKGLFYGIHGAHPARSGHLLVGRKEAAWLTTDGGEHFRKMQTGAFRPATAKVSVVAYAPGAPDEEFWIGTDEGELFRTANGSVAVAASPADPAWSDHTPRVPPPPPPPPPAPPPPPVVTAPRWGAGNVVMGIAFDSTRTRDAAGRPARAAVAVDQQVWLWDDGWAGDGWINLSGTGATGLPPCPVTSVAFDPRNPGVLYAGTLAAVYVCMALPPTPAAPVAGVKPPAPGTGAVAAVVPTWAPFHRGMPLVLVTDLHVLPDPSSAVAASLLRCATYGRGMFECHLPPAPLGAWTDPETLLYVRQYAIDDGVHPRQTPAALNAAPVSGDPRVPAGRLPFDLVSGYDIRVDAPPYTWLEDTVDPVEFDEDLGTDPLVTGEVNFVYVQVHNRGWNTAAATEVHLFFAHFPVPAPGAAPAVPALPAAASWTGGFPAGPAPAPWERVGAAPLSVDLRPGEPRVVRFDFVPRAAPAARRVALLAVVRRGADGPAALPAAASPVDALLLASRQASLRVVPAGGFFPVYVRDGVEDSGHSGDVAWGGRSPDIIVVAPPAVPPADPHAAFADLGDPRAGDRLKGGADNTLYVRVHNPSRLPVEVEVELFRAPADQDAFKHAKWTAVPPVTPVAARPTRTLVMVPAGDRALATFRFTPADPDPGGDPAYRAYLLVALVHLPADSALPDPRGVDEVGEFWTLVRSSLAAKRAATRAVRWIP